ncbi:hypothetical protein RF11_08784 [Thelohanellus kitauei]|uniref:Uncharacterized protein n=1 Tax=Thelohanellus kitauei TaxID=669202 RepID=A0A0C2JPJ8_THEKT|nr:hypothetical protein RF11_08784 [Thelohanellus kitauei]
MNYYPILSTQFIRGRRVRGREENYVPTQFPTHTWNKFESATEVIACTTNAMEGWHCGLQSLFMRSHPTMWTLFERLKKDSCKQKTIYLQSTYGVEHYSSYKYRELQAKVFRAVTNHGLGNGITYVRCLAHLSFS